QAEVKEIKGFQIHNKSLLAYPISNSSDGIGGKFEGQDESWFAFGDRKMPPTLEAGFAIASNLLFLKEGERTISITVQFANPIKSISKTSRFGLFGVRKVIPFDITLTGDKDWVSKNVVAQFTKKSKSLVIEFSLGVEEPPI